MSGMTRMVPAGGEDDHAPPPPPSGDEPVATSLWEQVSTLLEEQRFVTFHQLLDQAEERPGGPPRPGPAEGPPIEQPYRP